MKDLEPLVSSDQIPHCQDQLAMCLDMVRRYDAHGDYERRNSAVYNAISWACLLGFGAGFRIDPKEPEWPVAFIDLPTGQISFHLPSFDGEWDGHSTDLKWDRAGRFVSEYQQRKPDASTP